MREFIVEAEIFGIGYYEDPRCPWFWKGSGCFDIEVQSSKNAVVYVVAKDEESASKIAKEYKCYDCDFGRAGCLEIIDVDVLNVFSTKEDVESEIEEVVDVKYE